MPKQRVALGLTVRTGRAVVVVVGGTRDAPVVLEKARVDVATTFEEGAVFHVASEMPLASARAHVRAAERRFTKLAERRLAELVGRHDAKLVGTRIVAPAEKSLPPFESILKAHPLLHAAEGELYRRVYATAASALAIPVERVAPEALSFPAMARALGLRALRVERTLAALGKSAGRPWAAEQKHAALAGWLALAGA